MDLIIDKVVGNISDKYSSKEIITNFKFHFDTIENNLDFAYYCLRYHLDYLQKVYFNDTNNDQIIKIGKNFEFHYHVTGSNEWWYFQVKLTDDIGDFSVDDFINNKIKVRIGMSPSTRIVDNKFIEQLEGGFNKK